MTSPRKNFGFSSSAARSVSIASAVRPAPSSAVASSIASSGVPRLLELRRGAAAESPCRTTWSADRAGRASGRGRCRGRRPGAPVRAPQSRAAHRARDRRPAGASDAARRAPRRSTRGCGSPRGSAGSFFSASSAASIASTRAILPRVQPGELGAQFGGFGRERQAPACARRSPCRSRPSTRSAAEQKVVAGVVGGRRSRPAARPAGGRDIASSDEQERSRAVRRIFMTIMTPAVTGRNVPDAAGAGERMPVDPELLEILACPNCKTKVELVKNGTALKCATVQARLSDQGRHPRHAAGRGDHRTVSCACPPHPPATHRRRGALDAGDSGA